MTIGGKTVSLHPEQVGQLIEELSNARASMMPEPAMNVPPGWRFVSTKNPAMAVQKQSNGDRSAGHAPYRSRLGAVHLLAGHRDSDVHDADAALTRKPVV